MKRPNVTLLPLAAVFLATAAWSFSIQASNAAQDDRPEMPEMPETAECCAELEPDVVAAGADVALAVSFPSDPGEVVAVRTEDGSGIVVLGFHATEDGSSALTTQLEIPDTAAGSWWLEFDAAGEICKALLTVTESALER